MARRTQPADDGDHGLSEREQAILDFIRRWTGLQGYPPSQREIADAVGLKSASTVNHYIKHLAKWGFLAYGAGSPRTSVPKPPRLRLIRGMGDESGKTLVGPDSPDMVTMPRLEQIAAGGPVVADPYSEETAQNPVETARLPREKVGHGRLFAVRVTGESMIGAGIFDGDYVVVRQQADANDGDIVAARTGDEVTVKTIKHVNGHVLLMPENPSYEPIPGDDYRLMGKAVAIVRI